MKPATLARMIKRDGVIRTGWRLIFRPEELEPDDGDDPYGLAIYSVGGEPGDRYGSVEDAIAGVGDRLRSREIRSGRELDAMIIDDPTRSDYFKPIENFPADFGAADRERLTAAYTSMIRDELVPAYRRLRAFVHDEYLPHTRDSVAWSALPDGDAWYAFYVAEHTTTSMTPE